MSLTARIAYPGKPKTVYVIGHRNPDTDSVVSAAAYAALKRAQGARNCVAARAGKASAQTEYIFNRFGETLPEFIPDLIPRVDYYYNPDFTSIEADVPLWEAMTLLQHNENRMLPVVDAAGRHRAVLHYSFIAQKMLRICNPRQKTAIQTSIDLLATVLSAQVLVSHNASEVSRSPIVVAAAEDGKFREFLDTHIPANTIVVSGGRKMVEEYAVERGVRAIIITNGVMLDRALREKAEEKGVSVLVSPYDTSSTTLLLIYSMPASSMANVDLAPVNLKEPIRKIAPLLATAPGKSLPVVNDDGVVVGVVSENDLFREANVEVIMVDHNEQTQAIEGIEHYRIQEIIDHHRLGNLTTRNPITFINKPVGATCTIVAGLYRENQIPLTQSMASILLCGILADTLVLQSATTTATDRELADYLATIANLDLDRLGKDVMAAASNISGRTAEELVRQDLKVYNEAGASFSISQIEVGNPREALQRKQEFLEVLEAERQKTGALFCALLVTDVIELSSLMILAADPRFEQTVALPKQEESVYVLRDVVSRKKQLVPILAELVEKYQAK